MPGDAPTTAPSDTAISWSLGRLQSQDQQAWREAYQELWPIAFRVVSHRVFTPSSAEDLAQETLMVIHTQINRFIDERHIRLMTVTIAKFKTSHYLRDQTAAKRDRRQEVAIDAAADVATAAPLVQTAMDLETALGNLEPIDRELLEGHFILGLKSHELAEKHGINASTVRGRMKRAMDRLKIEFGLQWQRAALP